MLFSRITLKQDLETKKLFHAICADEYKIHQHLWTLFSVTKDQKRNFLYRRDDIEKWPRFYTVSENEPIDHESLWDIESRTYDPKIKAGQKLYFQLRVNPVITRKIDEFRKTNKSKIRKNGEKHKRVRKDDIIMLEKKRLKEKGKLHETFMPRLIHNTGVKWLKNGAERNYGFTIEDQEYKIEDNDHKLKVVVDGYFQHRFYKRGQSEPIKVSVLDFSGILTVTEPEKFRQTLYCGIGPAKAFGCGLLLVKPA